MSPTLDGICTVSQNVPSGLTVSIWVSKLTTIGSDSGLSPKWRQAIIRTNAGILLMGPLRTNFSEILIKICSFSFRKMHLKMSSVKCWPFCLSLSVLKCCMYSWDILLSDEQKGNWKSLILKNLPHHAVKMSAVEKQNNVHLSQIGENAIQMSGKFTTCNV